MNNIDLQRVKDLNNFGFYQLKSHCMGAKKNFEFQNFFFFPFLPETLI